MIEGLTSVIIPTYQHADVLPAAIESALAQTVPVEVVVVDDGSTDNTTDVVCQFVRFGIRYLRLPHAGPSNARNEGIEAAAGEFLMFLDADDVIAPNKVERQLAELASAPRAGWVLCDVRIEEVGGRVEPASTRYGYADMRLDGWIAPLLAQRNFIPIHSPLIRRSALGDLRFDDANFPEDWFFWHALAVRARCSYVPEVLATYRKRKGGRNASRRGSAFPGIAEPLRLNLGCGTPDSRSWHPIDGMLNLDKSLGWRFEDGLRDHADGSVAGITVSHALMYVAPADWPRVFAEFARVLQPGGVVRITEDDTANPASRTYARGWKGSESATTLTDPAMVRRYLEGAGLTAADVTATRTGFADHSLLQAQHGEAPHVFFIEGTKPAAILFAPHADDEALFAAFTIIRHRPRIVVCFPSAGDYGDTATRLEESRDAMAILGGGPVEQWPGGDLVAQMREVDRTMRPTRVFAPSPDASHPDHVAVALAALAVFGDRVKQFQTYNALGKVRKGDPVAFEQEWVGRKREALACYRSQIAHPRARVFFDWDLAEYRAP